jgi:hypothetical protein
VRIAARPATGRKRNLPLAAFLVSMALFLLTFVVVSMSTRVSAATLASARATMSMASPPIDLTHHQLAGTPDMTGYWLVASDGGIFTFGDAGYYGSTGGISLNKPIVGMAPTSDGKGYWLVASDGGIFTFGDAGYYGSEPGEGIAVENTVDIESSPSGHGYWIEGSDGRVSAFGDATNQGSMLGKILNKPIVGFASVSIPSPVTTPPFSITTAPLPNATIGNTYSASLSATGGTAPYSWELISGSLPSGLSLSSTGAITGTPSNQLGSSFTVEATDSTTPTAQTATAILSISVSGTPLVIATTSLPSATSGSLYSTTLVAIGGNPPYSWSVITGSLPSGLNLSTSGVISGTPSSQGSSSFTAQVTDASTPTAEFASATFSISVSAPSLPFVVSPNWSGYVAGNGPFTGVSGTFTVPSLYAGTPTGDRVTEWVGIDGGVNGDSSLIQAGVDETPDPSNPNLFYLQPWWEILPAPQTNITTVTISPGDEVTVTIGQISGAEWGIILADDTNGESFTTDQVYTGSGSSAEWILEAPTLNGQQTVLAPYSPDVTFSQLEIAPINTSVTEWVMVQNDLQVSTPSALTSTGFNVAYGDIAPPAP